MIHGVVFHVGPCPERSMQAHDPHCELNRPMNLSTATTDEKENGYFKIPAPAELRHAKIKVGRKMMSVDVQDSSIDGYTVLVSRKQAKRLKAHREYRMEYNDAEVDVLVVTVANARDGGVQIELRRVREIVENAEKVPRSWLIRFGGSRFQDPSLAAALYGGLVLFLFALLALPGVGDHLGTADRIQEAFLWILQSVNGIL